MKFFIVLAAAVVGLVMWVFATRTSLPEVTESQAHPNVLVIVTDDQRMDRSMTKVTPTVTRLFKEQGIWFRSAFATTPVCCQSRASILTGMYAHNHGVRLLTDSGNLDQQNTLEYQLRSQGYQTAIAGKFLNAWYEPPEHFDRWATMLPHFGYHDVDWNIDGQETTIDEYSTSVVKRYSVRFLDHFEESDERPWFLYVAPYTPHEPFVVEPRYVDSRVPSWKPNPAQTETDVSDKPDYVSETQVRLSRAQRIRTRQLKMMRSADALVASVFAKLASLGEDDNTLAVFVSDNGYMWHDHGMIDKHAPYDSSIRIPLALYWPGRVTSEIRYDLVANIDIAPTIYEATGIEPTYEVDGRSLLTKGERPRLLFEHWRETQSFDPVPDWLALRTKRYLYTEYSGGPEEYYDLDADPFELMNLLGNTTDEDDPDTDSLSRQLQRDASCSGAECP